ncbi:hypothetical protein ACOSP7_018895 [Xanthoceras sorbifolium]
MEEKEESQPSKCFFDMWQQQQQVLTLPPNHQRRRFDVQLRVNIVVEYLPQHFNMNVRSEKIRVLLERGDLVVDANGDMKVRETMSTILRYTAPVTESELERIARTISTKATTMDGDPCNAGLVYVKDYCREVELSWASSLGSEGPESLKTPMPALDSAVAGLNEMVYDGGCCSEEQCSICLVAFDAGEEISRTPCAHDFHRTCIANWLKRSHLCPLCRFPFPVCENTEALCPFKAAERPRPSSQRVFRTKPRMRARTPWGRSHVFGRRNIVDPII